MPKKPPKKVKPKGAPKSKERSKSELSEKQLEHVSGGAAVDYFLKIDGVVGETSDHKNPSTFTYQPVNPFKPILNR